MNNPSIIAMIPARIGSTRLPFKNLALVGGHPMMSYAVRAAREAEVFDRIVVNGDHPAFAQVAARYGAEFYMRPGELGSSHTQSDDVVLDFMRKHPAEIVAWVNTINPLQGGEELRAMVDHFLAEGLDSMISVERKQVHCMMGGEALNFSPKAKFDRTQDLVPVESFAYSLMIWRSRVFQAEMEARGHAFFCGKFGTCPVSKLAAIVIKTEEDLLLADGLLRAMEIAPPELAYDPLTPTRD
ncbi:MAG: hypothetical protein V3S01_04980 [Dehalococcoidia bacterium]